MAWVTFRKQQIFFWLDLVWLTSSWNEREPTRRHYNATFPRDCVPKHSFSHVCHIIQLGTRWQCFRSCLHLNTYNRLFVLITSIQVLNTRSSWSLLQQCANIQKYLYNYDMTKGTLFELANPYPHTPITKHLSGIPDTAGLGFWCVLIVLHMQFRLSFRINNYLCNRQPSICSRRATMSCLMNSEKLHCNGAS